MQRLPLHLNLPGKLVGKSEALSKRAAGVGATSTNGGFAAVAVM
jgi:hypothetical protein